MSKARELADVIGTQDTTENVLQGRRNLIINGDAKVNQRGNSTGVTSSAYVGPDRFYTLIFNDGSVDVSQNTSGVLADTGHGQSLKIDVNTADASLSSGQYFFLWYIIKSCRHWISSP